MGMRSDVVAYRNDVFLPILAALVPTFVQWTYPDLDSDSPILIYPKSLPPGARPRIPVTHDECNFNAKDWISRSWVKDGRHTILW